MKIDFFLFKNRLFIINCIFTIFILSKCGYQPYTNYTTNQKYSAQNKKYSVLLYTFDPYHTIARMIKNELILNNITITNNVSNSIPLNTKTIIPCLDIYNISKNKITISVFSDGTISEYKIVLKVQARFYISNTENYHPINISIHRILIRNPGLALFNYIQDREILNEMYQDIAQKIVQQFLLQLNNYKN